MAAYKIGSTIYCISKPYERMILQKFQVRCGRYPAPFIDAVPKKKDLEKLEKEGVMKELAFSPVKAAPNDLSCSLFRESVINHFTNIVMRKGQKKLARQLLEETFVAIKRTQLAKYHASEAESKRNIELSPRNIFHHAVENCKPIIILTPIKRGGVIYQVPVPVTPKQSTFIAMKWLIEAGKNKERTVHFPEQLSKEILDAFHNKGRVVKRKQDLHKQCEANKAFAHYRWS
ncbi:mitochondrial ribosomal protein S7 [Tachypleus tridentatus]|uniref:mitochondrial ribosomal protein S7 n=1 Tax=Tachypleus tridentatus TaxID=6853 RepID=UPI003FD4BA4E